MSDEQRSTSRLLSGSQLSRLLSGLIEAAWLGLLVATALYFNPYSLTSFEPDKATMARAYLLLMLGCWAALCAYGGRSAARAPRAAVVGACIFATWAASVVLSAANSIAPALSWWGSYDRGQGAWLEIGYVALFAALATRLRSAQQWRRLRLTIAASSVPVCLLALAQRSGIPILLGNEPLEVNATFGNPTFLGAFLLLTLFVTADFVVETATSMRGGGQPVTAHPARLGLRRAALPTLIITLQLAALLATRGSAALIGLLFGLSLLVAGAFAMRRIDSAPPRSATGRWRRRPIVLASVAVVAAIVWLGATADRTADGNQVVELATMFNPERDTNRVRLLIWDAVQQAMLASAGDPEEVRNTAWRWLVGFGPETTWLALEHSYPAGLASVESWQSLPDRAHNQVLEILLTRGLLGVGCYLLTAAALLAIGLRAAGLLIEAGSTRRFTSALLAGSTLGAVAALAASGRWSLAAVGLIPGMVVGALGYLIGRVEGVGESPPQPRRQRWLALLLTAAIVAHLVETQFGIAVTASQTYFWLLAGALVALRYRGWSPGDAADAAAPGGTVDGLVVGTILLTLVFGLMTPGAAVPLVVALVLLASWLGGWVLSSLGMAAPALFGRRGRRFALVSAALMAAYIGFHKLQTATATVLQARGDDLAAASTFATFFDGYQAWMLAATLATGVLLAASKHDDDQNVGDRSPARTVLAVTLILALGMALPRAPHVAAARADILAAHAERARLAGRFASAGRLYREALSLRADEIVYRIGLAKVQTDWAGETSGDVRNSRFGRAARQLRLALQAEQAGATEHANLARLYTLWAETEVDATEQASRLARADRHYRNALVIRPQSARYYAEWGRLSVLQGELEPARWRFGRSLVLDPTQGQTYLWVRPLLSSDLLEASNALAELGPDVGAITPAQVHAALVEHFIEAGLFEAAIEAAFRLAEAIPEQALAHWTLAGLYSRTSRPAVGLPHARRAHQRAQGWQRRQIARLIDNLEAAIERTAS